jgi:hypothetical protein
MVERPQFAEAIEAASAIAGVDANDPDLPHVRMDPAWRTQPFWVASELRAAIASIIQPVSDSADAPIITLIESLRTNVTSARSDLEQRRRERRDHAGWDSLVPSDSVAQRVPRYEAHLSRQAFQALHELEALQARRNGRSAPLARLDVSGDL